MSSAIGRRRWMVESKEGCRWVGKRSWKWMRLETEESGCISTNTSSLPKRMGYQDLIFNSMLKPKTKIE
ncbi:unnamed protein product [Lactuca virosa]|uniref:Uncharacterized protein n=1 Tax=Lactuca virosa TaxID=75947 RepID=A0AAU9MYF8_9ASTR|nr:unnamed protein product [Lactuca virosa]